MPAAKPIPVSARLPATSTLPVIFFKLVVIFILSSSGQAAMEEKCEENPLEGSWTRTQRVGVGARRSRVMIQLAAFAGLRAHEIAKIRGEDVDPMARTLRVTGKGNVTAVLPLHPVLVEATKGIPRGLVVPGQLTTARSPDPAARCRRHHRAGHGPRWDSQYRAPRVMQFRGSFSDQNRTA